MYLGLDIGSSYCKAAAICKEGRLTRTASVALPNDFFTRGRRIKPFVQHLIETLCDKITEGQIPTAVAISAVSPALVAFYEDENSAELVFSHLTPSAIAVNQGNTLSSRLSFRRQRTDDRLARALLPPAKFYLPLGSAIAFLLDRSKIILDPVSAYELGFRSVEELRAFCGASFDQSAGKDCQITRIGPVVAVTTDTCASMLGAGLRGPSDGMLYYGSYFSAAELNLSLEEMLFGAELSNVPYYWRVSLPMYGVFLQSFLLEISGTPSVDEAFSRFGEAIEQGCLAAPEASTVKATIVVPDRLTSDSPLSVTLQGLTNTTRFSDLAVALARPLADTIVERSRSDALGVVRTWYAAGGATRSPPLLSLTSKISGLSQIVRKSSWSAKGTAMLASWCANLPATVIDSDPVRIVHRGGG